MLSEMSQRKTDIVSSKTTIATKKPKLIDTENRLVVDGKKVWRAGKNG